MQHQGMKVMSTQECSVQVNIMFQYTNRCVSCPNGYTTPISQTIQKEETQHYLTGLCDHPTQVQV